MRATIWQCLGHQPPESCYLTNNVRAGVVAPAQHRATESIQTTGADKQLTNLCLSINDQTRPLYSNQLRNVPLLTVAFIVNITNLFPLVCLSSPTQFC